ncbi:chain-length determining protein [Salinicola rhizosphaerae]|uniref:Capsule polysaccharide export inner-membrane protein KpsE n=1 Tax=Salinicola rhizosphaerae TaxID=1443141 RepID=A0ABQ3DTU5_9GAMM|nr:chain-length determining protein [Salinicola rhizosphaerae]GHB11306.1 capsule polysaccharide export inner-membrane protein KpsE [Salinicola rhizosphaerae]
MNNSSSPTRASFLRKYLHWIICLIAIVAVSLYWALWASDRYVSHANVVLESPQIAAPTLDFSSLLSGGGSANAADMLLLRDFLRSVDMLKLLISEADFRNHYANSGADFFSRLGDENAPLEELHDYYLSRVSVELDDYAGVLRVDVEAFTPEKAHQIAQLLLTEGERHMNEMGQRLAEEQVKFLEQQVALLETKFQQTRNALLDYQNANGLVSPTGTVESLNSVVSGLEGQLAIAKARRSALGSYQSARSPEMVRINSEITALNDQIAQERERLARQSGNALNSISSEYQTLMLQAQFAQDSYSGALAALENTRIEAARKLKQVSVLQTPTLPEYPEQPERLYNCVVFAVIALFITLILNMLILIVKDHRD